MKPSTAVELVGFACFSVAAFLSFLAWRLVPGFAVTGFCLLVIGYGTEDERAALTLNRVLAPHRRRRMLAQARRVARKAARQHADKR